jgi:hypothetical protein
LRHGEVSAYRAICERMKESSAAVARAPEVVSLPANRTSNTLFSSCVSLNLAARFADQLAAGEDVKTINAAMIYIS